MVFPLKDSIILLRPYILVANCCHLDSGQLNASNFGWEVQTMYLNEAYALRRVSTFVMTMHKNSDIDSFNSN
jgi:hypothetical protein